MAIVASNQISIVDVTDGAEGKGVSSVTPEYYLSASKTTQTGGSWSTNPPTWSSGKYLWVRHIVTYTDSSVSRTDPYCDTSWEAVNEVQVGSRNLLLNTKSFTAASSTSLSGSFLSGISLSEDKYRDLAVRGATLTASVTEICRYNFTDFNLGDTFTFSFYAKGNVPELRVFFYGATGYVQVANCVNSQGKTSINADGRLSFNITSDWQRYWVTWTLKNTGDISIPKYVMLRTNGATSGQTVYVCGCKLESGNKATDWNPAPEDVDAKTNEAAKTATNFMKFNNSVLVIGDMTANPLGNNVLIDSDSVDIRNGNTIRASYGETTTIGNTTGKHILIDSDSVDIKNGETILSQFTDNSISLGIASEDANIYLCGKTASISRYAYNTYPGLRISSVGFMNIIGSGITIKSTDSCGIAKEFGGSIDINPPGTTGFGYLNLGVSETSMDGVTTYNRLIMRSSHIDITGTLVLSKTTDASGTANNSPALIVGGTATQPHLEFDANEIMAKKDGTTVGGLTLNGQGGNVYIGHNGAGNLFGICQEVTQGDLPPAPGQDTTKTIKYKSGRTKVLIEMWTTGSTGYYDSVYKTISSSMPAVSKTLLTRLHDSLGYFSISKSGDITLYNTTKSSATSTGLINYRVIHFN